MKLNASTKDLKAVIDRLSNLPGAVSGSPVTQCVSFEASMDGLRLTRFSSEARIAITLEAATIEDEEGTFAVDHTALARMVSQLPAKEVTLSSDDKKLHFASGRAKGSILMVSELEAQAPEADLESDHISLPLEAFERALDYASMAMHREESEKGFNGVCLRMIGDHFALIGSNKRWLHVALLDYKLPVDCVIAAKTVEGILKAIGKQAGTCTLSVGENTVALLTPDSDMNFALTNFSFPNIVPMISPENSSIRSKVKVNRLEIIEALKTASGISDEIGRPVDIEVDGKEMTLLANNGSDTKARDSEIAIKLDCKATKKEAFTVVAAPIFTSLATFSEIEEVELVLCPNTLFVRESDRIAVFALRIDPATK